MEASQILDELILLVRRRTDDPDAPTSLSTHLWDDLGMDSLTQVDLIVDIEGPSASLCRTARLCACNGWTTWWSTCARRRWNRGS